MGAGRVLIVNADDFGLTHGVNRGIIEAHENGIVTSTSLMVKQSAADEAAAYAAGNPALGVGLHLDLGEWVFSAGSWSAVYEVVPLDDPAMVEEEALAQLETFRCLVGRDPTHIDSHQHVHRDEPVRSIVVRLARELEVQVRHCSEGVRYCGSFYGQTTEGEPFPEAITVQRLIEILRGLPAGATELACHPGYANGLESTYRSEREDEIPVLCDPEVLAFLSLEKITLASFDRGQFRLSV